MYTQINKKSRRSKHTRGRHICTFVMIIAILALTNSCGSDESPDILDAISANQSLEKEIASVSTRSCGSPCTQCVLNTRTDILPFYQKNGWDTSCSNRDNIVANWCRIDPLGCNQVKSGACNSSCNSTVDPFCIASCGCDAQGNNCNFGTQHTDLWCKCCAANCGGNRPACNQQGYQGDRGFPTGTSRQCGCIHPYGNGHDFNLANNNNLSACYQNLRANSNITAGFQTIWHPGRSKCSSGSHMHIQTSGATGLARFGIDCLDQPKYNGQTCTLDTSGAGQGCYYLWQGPR